MAFKDDDIFSVYRPNLVSAMRLKFEDHVSGNSVGRISCAVSFVVSLHRMKPSPMTPAMTALLEEREVWFMMSPC